MSNKYDRSTNYENFNPGLEIPNKQTSLHTIADDCIKSTSTNTERGVWKKTSMCTADEYSASSRLKENSDCHGNLTPTSSRGTEKKPASSSNFSQSKKLFGKPVQLTCRHNQCQRYVEGSDGNDVECAGCNKTTSTEETVRDEDFGVKDADIRAQCQQSDGVASFDKSNDHCNNQQQTFDCMICRKHSRSGTASQHYKSDLHNKAVKASVHRLKKEKKSQFTNQDCKSESKNNSEMVAVDRLFSFMNIISIFLDAFGALKEDAQRMNRESTQIQKNIVKIEEKSSAFRLSIEEQRTFVGAMKTNLDVLYQDSASFIQTLDDTQQTTYNGIFIWRIGKFREKSLDAQSERQTSIFSPPFYSSQTGYKMCARLYLNGDGTARGTHISLFFVLMRGVYDSILKFPFNYKVTFCLFDQTPQQRHIVDSFRPDMKSNSFQRPRSEMNIASGIPKFVPLTTIQKTDSPYIQNDTMFIKIMVDFGEMPKTVLPFACSLNPGLPMHVQQAMIQEEIERKSRSESKNVSLGPVETK